MGARRLARDRPPGVTLDRLIYFLGVVRDVVGGDANFDVVASYNFWFEVRVPIPDAETSDAAVAALVLVASLGFLLFRRGC